MIPELSTTDSQSPLTSLKDVKVALENFAARHCGPPVEQKLEQKKGLLGLFSKTPRMKKHKVWWITKERFPFTQKVKGQVKQGLIHCVVLNLSEHPEAMIGVWIEDADCHLAVMEAYKIPDIDQSTYIIIHEEVTQAKSNALTALLHGLIEKGLFVKQEGKLHYVSPG